jgi:hypothetical protein
MREWAGLGACGAEGRPARLHGRRLSLVGPVQSPERRRLGKSTQMSQRTWGAFFAPEFRVGIHQKWISQQLLRNIRNRLCRRMLGTAMDSREDRGCAIGRGIGLLDNSQQLGSVKWDMPSAPAPASVAGTSFPIIRCACRASIIRGPARASPSASRASRWSIWTASSAASNQSSRCQKHTIHSIAICHEPDQERSRTPHNAEGPTMDTQASLLRASCHRAASC